MRKNKCAKSGYINHHDQLVVDQDLTYKSNHKSAKPWKLRCLKCKNEYGANGCDVHIRKCPECQKGKPSLPLV